MALDWSKIDSDKKFQRLINHLFALECNSPGFIPSSPYIGADGGWDGRFKGLYPPENMKGLWAIESKWTTQSFDSAAAYLRTQVRSTLAKAEENRVQHLRIATNAELRVAQVVNLELLGKGQVRTLAVWHRERLSIRIERQPFLRMFFFDQAQRPKFVPTSQYMSEMESNLLTGNAQGIRTFDAYLAKAAEFIRCETRHIFVVQANGGLGKSHLMRAIATQAHGVDPLRQPWFMKQGLRSVEDAIQEELVADRQHLVLFDDADRSLDETEAVVRAALSLNGHLKVILSFRSAGKFALDRILDDARRRDLVDEVRVLEWRAEDLISLLRHAAKKESVDDERDIVAAYRNPYIVAWIGRNIGGRKNTDISGLQKRLLAETLRDAETCLKDIGILNVRILLANTAAAVPFPASELPLIAAMAKSCATDAGKLRNAFPRLVDAGVLRNVGRMIRFNPDMKGDFFLSEALAEFSARDTEALLRAYLEFAAERLLINIEAASRFRQSQVVRDTLADLVRVWVREADTTPLAQRRKRLGYASHLSALAPQDCADLLAEYLRLEPAHPAVTKRLYPSPDDHLGTDSFGPVVIQLVRAVKLRRDIVNIVESLASKRIPGGYDTYNPETLIRRCVSPLANKALAILQTLGCIADWLKEPTTVRTKLLSEALEEVLGGTHRYEESTASGFRFGTVAQPDTPEMRGCRDRAMILLSQMLDHASADVQLAAVEVAASHGRRASGPPVPSPLPLADKIAEERKVLVNQVGRMFLASSDFRLRSLLEDTLLHWWATRSSSATAAARYLSKAERSAEYLVFRYFVSPRDATEDFNTFKRGAPTKDRWQWYVKRNMRKKHEQKPDDFIELVEKLSHDHPTPESVVEYLRHLSDLIEPRKGWGRPPIVTCWVQHHPDVFRSLRARKDQWSRLPEEFQLEADTALATSDRRHLRLLAKQVTSALDSTSIRYVDTFLRLLGRSSLPSREVDAYLTHLVEKGGSEVRNLVAFRARSIFEGRETAAAEVTLVGKIVRRERGVAAVAENLSFWLEGLRERLGKAPQGAVYRLRRTLRKKLSEIDTFDYHAGEIATFCCRNVTELCELLEERINESARRWKEDKGRGTYKVVPYEGTESIREFVGDFDSFSIFIDWLVQLDAKRYFALGGEIARIARSALGEEGEQRPETTQHLRRFIEGKVTQGKVDGALTAARYLPPAEENAPLFLSLGRAALERGKADEVRRLFHALIFPQGAWTSNLGEDPPQLVTRKKVFERMAENAGPGKLRSLFKDCARILQLELETNRRSDEELLNPRG
jgi:hypothetical protein